MADIATIYLSNPRSNPNLWFIIAGTIFGTQALCLFLVARHYLQTDAAALFSVFLFLFSTPVITGAWVVVAGFQSIVPMLICLGLLLYWRLLDSPRYRAWYALALSAILFFGPWFREFIGLLALLIIFLEIQRAHRFTPLIALAAVFFGHALFPTAIVKFVAFPDLPLQPVFTFGSLGQQAEIDLVTDKFVLSQLIAQVKWSVLFHFLVLFPPILFGLGLISCLLSAVRINRNHDTILDAQRKRREVTFLVFWFLLFFLPFFKVFTEQVHLAYVLVPTSIIMAIAVENLWQVVWQLTGPHRLWRYGVALLLVIVIGDHTLNLYGSYRVVHAINEGILTIANLFRINTPKNSIVVSNVLHTEDIRFYSAWHFLALGSLTAGMAKSTEATETPAKLEQLLVTNREKHPIYFLSVEFDYRPDKVIYHSHKYVRLQSVATEYIGLIYVTNVQYPYLDPFKTFIPREFISFMGTPDLENDFYIGPAQDGSPFMREVYAEYHVYRVTGTEVHPWDPNAPLRFIEEGYKGFNILHFGDLYVAVAHVLGPMDLTRLDKPTLSQYQADGHLVIANSLEEAKQLVDQWESEQTVTKLLEANYRGFNIITYRGQFYALAQALGPMDLTELDERKLDEYQIFCAQTHKCAIANTLEEAKELIDQLYQPAFPELVEEGYKGFNIVAYSDKFYAVAQDIGPVDINQVTEQILNEYQQRDKLAIGNSLEEARQLVDQIYGRAKNE
jgi:hypothetical protein